MIERGVPCFGARFSLLREETWTPPHRFARAGRHGRGGVLRRFHAARLRRPGVDALQLRRTRVAGQPRVRRDHVPGLGKQIAEKDFGEGPLYRPEIKIQYEVGGVEYRDWHYDVRRELIPAAATAPRPFSTGSNCTRLGHKTYSCWYDPANPSIAVLVRGYGLVSWLVFTVPISFIIIGAGGLAHALLHWGKSAERRALMAQRGRPPGSVRGRPRCPPAVSHGSRWAPTSPIAPARSLSFACRWPIRPAGRCSARWRFASPGTASWRHSSRWPSGAILPTNPTGC